MIRYLSGHRQSYGTPQLSDDWGGFDYVIEIDDQYVTRQVNVFENGEILRYSCEHWCDEYGMMFIGKFSLKQKAARGRRLIEPDEFEKLWRRALDSANWAKQQNTAKMDQWGSWTDSVSNNNDAA